MKKKGFSVVYIVTQLELGGAQKVCLSLWEGIQKKGILTSLIAGDTGPLVTRTVSSHAYLLPTLRRDISVKALLSELKTFISLVRILKRLKKKHVHLIVHTHSTKAGFLGRWAAWWAGIPLRIHTIHGYGFHAHQSWLPWLLLFGIEWLTSFITTHFVCVSAHDVKTGIRLLPGFAQHHSIIRAGVTLNQFSVKNIPTLPSKHKPFIFGSISCFKPQKNLIDLLQAFKKVYASNERARLEIIGDGIQRAFLEKWIKTNQLSSVITLHGWQQHIMPITKEWHAFALSSLWEGLPCALIEARLQRLPIVSYKTGGIPEIVYHGQNGYLVEQKNWTALAERMGQLIAEKSHYRSMQLFPDKLADFDTAQMIHEHIHLYKKLSNPNHALSKVHRSPAMVYNHFTE